MVIEKSTPQDLTPEGVKYHGNNDIIPSFLEYSLISYLFVCDCGRNHAEYLLQLFYE